MRDSEAGKELFMSHQLFSGNGFKGGRVAPLLSLAGLVTSLCISALAVPLSPGGGAALSGTTAAAQPDLAGVVLEDRIRPWTFTLPSGAVVKGTFQDRVSRSNATGLLHFSFRLKNDAASQGVIARVRRGQYGPSGGINVDFRVDGLGSVGAPAARFLTGTDIDVLFDFANAPIKPGGESRFHFIATKVKEYDESSMAIIEGGAGGGVRFKVFSPQSAPVAPTGPTTRQLPNLQTNLVGPKSAKRGEDISKLIKVRAFNSGTATAPGTVGTLNPTGGHMIDVILSKDRALPAGYSTYSPNFSEDVLLLGGRISNTRDLAPSGSETYATGATIPLDTPPGLYFLALRIDPGEKVAESNETDNTFFSPIRIF